jgi:hypothetical protein
VDDPPRTICHDRMDLDDGGHGGCVCPQNLSSNGEYALDCLGPTISEPRETPTDSSAAFLAARLADLVRDVPGHGASGATERGSGGAGTNRMVGILPLSCTHPGILGPVPRHSGRTILAISDT